MTKCKRDELTTERYHSWNILFFRRSLSLLPLVSRRTQNFMIKTGQTLTRTHLQLKLHEYKINFLENVEISIYILYINFSAHHVNNHDNPQYVITAK